MKFIKILYAYLLMFLVFFPLTLLSLPYAIGEWFLMDGGMKKLEDYIDRLMGRKITKKENL